MNITADSKLTEIGDYDRDGVADLMVKFDRALIESAVTPGDVTITVTGELIDGVIFEGSDIIKVIQ